MEIKDDYIKDCTFVVVGLVGFCLFFFLIMEDNTVVNEVYIVRSKNIYFTD